MAALTNSAELIAFLALALGWGQGEGEAVFLILSVGALRPVLDLAIGIGAFCRLGCNVEKCVQVVGEGFPLSIGKATDDLGVFETT